MNEQEKLSLRIDALRHYSNNGVGSAEDLHRFAIGITGHRWLDTVVCPRHHSPWSLVCDVYSDAAPEILAVGARSGFKTQTLALLNAIESLLKPGIKIVHASASITQALRAQEFTKMFLGTDALRLSGLVDDAKLGKWIIRLKNGSTIEVLPGTMTGLNSVHAQRLRLDEFELVKPSVIDEARMVPGTFDGYERNLVFISARKFRNGNVDKILHDRRYKDVKKVMWCIAEIVENCPEDRRGKKEQVIEVEDPLEPGAPPMAVKVFEKCGTCAIVPDCRGQFARSDGWARIDDLIEEFSKVDRSTWNAQKRSRRVEVETGLVFQFTTRKNVQDHELIPGMPLNMVVDFGGGARGQTAALFWQEVEGVVRVLGEYLDKRGDPDIDVPNVEETVRRFFPGAKVGQGIGDSAVPNILRMWNQRLQLYRLKPVRKLSTKRDMIGSLSSLINPVGGHTRYVVHSRCRVHIEQMGSFRHQDRITARVRQSAYADTDNDTVDAASYLSLQVGDVTRVQPRVWVINTKERRVETSEPPIKFHDGKDLTFDDLIGRKFWGLIQRQRRRG